ncbi:PilZ domain-containing protein [Thiosocius teredinicola]|uniref:PilZ domain-containing protein n=1 Tax=Thiosocius teredinicola TaxID=1973002 RepID=UPI0013DDA437
MGKEERRKHPRLPLSARVTVRDPSFGSMVVNTRDISDCGLFVENGGHPYPALGTVIEVQAMDLPEEAEPLKARIIRTCIDGVGLEFLVAND